MAYNQLATLYDQFMEHAPYDKWIKFTEEIIQSYKKQVTNVLDLGCGTGEIAIRLARSGYQITGVDLSEDMLSCASEKAIQDQLPIQWVAQDICSLKGFYEIDLCISYCDVINYITNQQDVEKVFQNVYDALSNNGLFIFDVHHLPYVKGKLVNHTFTDVTDELVYIWDCEPGEEEGEMYHYLTFFQQDNHHYIRFDEEHHQRTYAVKIYEQLLKNAGFTKITFHADFRMEKEEVTKNSERIFIIAEK